MRFRPRVFELDGRPDVETLAARLSSRHGLALLDSAGGSPRRASVIAFDPLRGLDLPEDFSGLRAFHAQLTDAGGEAVPGPFRGGFIGALSYDLGVSGEAAVDAATDPWGSPRIAGGLYTDFIVIDEHERRAWLVLSEDPGDGRASVAERREEVRALLEAASVESGPVEPIGPLVRDTSPFEHRARVERLREHIAAGDLFQANIAHRLTRTLRGAPLDLYLRLRRANPAPYMAYLAWDESNARGVPKNGARTPRGALLSASPELLFEFERPLARTRPIKGTAPRGTTLESDAQNARDLLASEKDKAELAMIVDLARNDLGRCARAGSVRVEAFPRLETYATVHHLVADVAADVREDQDAFDLLAALFPGGSITGAPKLASMQAIAALERAGRGFFTGSMGFVDLRGRAAFNILIRTLVWRPRGALRDEGEVSFHVGGGITWSSDPDAEERETLFKAAGLIAAFEPRSQR